MPYFLGIDAGGTKTYCLIGDEQGHILGFGQAGTGNYEYRGVEHAAAENRKAVEAALADAGLKLSDISAIGMGIAGADVPEDYEMLEREIYTPLFGSIKRNFRNDSMGGLRGGTRNPYGVVIACGTGCVCAGRNRQGEETRVGGLGEEFGDAWSGSSLGREGLRCVWRARDHIIPPTRMTEMFIERAGCKDVEELFYKMYRKELTYDDLEPMGQIVTDAAFYGDAAACELLEAAGAYLGDMVNAVIRRLRMEKDEFDVVMAGGVFKSRSPVLAEAMRTRIHRVAPRARPALPLFEPVVGALLMGMEMLVTISDEVYERLTAQLLDSEKRYGVKFTAR